MYGLKVEKVNLKNPEEKKEVQEYLNQFELDLDQDVEYTLVIKEDEKIKATCSKAKNVLKCFAVSLDLRGEGVTSTLISALLDKLFEEGIYHSFIFTKPDKVQIFQGLNFKLIHKVEKVALLENGIYDIIEQINKMKNQYNIDKATEKVALVMNCNPFTLGHQFLIEEAAKEGKEVLVFIVEEERSLFSFDVRYNLVKEGVKHLGNVKVIPGGEYIISSATFPSYFLRKEDEKLTAYTKLDAEIFCNYFCKELNITKRFVGKEPFCAVTNAYNEALKTVLQEHKIQLVEMNRKETNGKQISASMVRQYIKEGKLDEINKIVPQVTWDFLNCKEGKEVREKITKSNSPH